MTSSDAKRRRSHLEIVRQILDACHVNTKKTVLMSSCNLSFKQFAGYLDLMLGANLLLIENDGPRLLFRISDKGREFVKAYEELMTMIEATSPSLVLSKYSQHSVSVEPCAGEYQKMIKEINGFNGTQP